MNEEATAIFNSLINDSKLLPLSSFKSNKFSKYNIFPHARTLPSFFDTNLQTQGRIVKYLKGPEGPLRAFYYQLFKLGYEIENSVDYSATIKNIIFSPALTNYSSSPSSGKQYNMNQYKRIIAEFFKLIETQVIPNAELTSSQYPIIDEAMLAILELIIQTHVQKRDSTGKAEGEELYRYGFGCENMENLTSLLKGLCEMFHINLQIFDNCYSFVQSDIFLYVENPQISYLAFLSEMAEVQSYEKTSESPSVMEKEKEQISSGYLEQDEQSDPDAYKTIRLSAGNRGPRHRVSGTLNRSLPGNNKHTSYNIRSSTQNDINILSKDYEIDDQAHDEAVYPSHGGNHQEDEDYNLEHEQKDGSSENNLQKNVFDSNVSGNQDEKILDLQKELKQLKQQVGIQQQKAEELRLEQQKNANNQIQEGIRQIKELVQSKPVQSTQLINVEENNQIFQAKPNLQPNPQPQPQREQILFSAKPENKPETQSQRFSKTSSQPIENSQPPPSPTSPTSEKNLMVEEQNNKPLLTVGEKSYPKSLYDVHTDKSITSFNNSVVQTKAERCDITDLGAVSEYQLRSLGTLRSKGKDNTMTPQVDKNQRKGMFERKKEYGESGENVRRKSQVKINDVVYEYQFKSFKYQRSNIKPVSIDLVTQSLKQRQQVLSKLSKNQTKKVSESYAQTAKNLPEKSPPIIHSSSQNQKDIQIGHANPEITPPTAVQATNKRPQNIKPDSGHRGQPELQFFAPKAINRQSVMRLNNKGQNRDRLGQKHEVNTLNKITGNEDSLGTFYREFSNTKVMQAMIEPFKTKVRATRQKFKGIRSKNFVGFH